MKKQDNLISVSSLQIRIVMLHLFSFKFPIVLSRRHYNAQIKTSNIRTVWVLSTFDYFQSSIECNFLTVKLHLYRKIKIFCTHKNIWHKIAVHIQNSSIRRYLGVGYYHEVNCGQFGQQSLKLTNIVVPDFNY